MIAKVYSAIPYGYKGRLIDVEGDISQGLPGFNIVGMATKTINEARERVRSALINSNFTFPSRKLTINLAPADLPKDGSHLDLPIAIVILILSKQLSIQSTGRSLFAGELSLSGEIRPVRGIINIAEIARSTGFTRLYLPSANLAQASLIPGMTLIGVNSLTELILNLRPRNPDVKDTLPEVNNSPSKSMQTPVATLSLRKSNSAPPATTSTTISSPSTPLLEHIHGQTLAKRALQIAIAGHHNLLISGPPGAGKTLLARVGANLLPAPSVAERIAITKIHSLAGLTDEIVQTRPFRTPHHTASLAAIVGGGTQLIPGEISLAHHGVLFLDELPEYPRSILEALRQPLEDQSITISRVGAKTTYPASFILIATMNPCPCGYLGDSDRECTCTQHQLDIYRKKLSGPLLDRIDLVINVQRVKPVELSASFALSESGEQKTHQNSPQNARYGATNPRIVNSRQKHSNRHVSNISAPSRPINADIQSFQTSTIVKNTITEAIARQATRYQHLNSPAYNGTISSYQATTLLKLTPAGRRLLIAATDKLRLSARAYFKTIRIARTIADLTPEAPTMIDAPHLAEALSLRHQPFT